MALECHKNITVIQAKGLLLTSLLMAIKQTETIKSDSLFPSHCEAIELPDGLIRYLSKIINIDEYRKRNSEWRTVYALYSPRELSRKDFKFLKKKHKLEDMYIHSALPIEIRRITEKKQTDIVFKFCNSKISFKLEIFPTESQRSYVFELDSYTSLPYYVQRGLQEAASISCRLGIDGISPLTDVHFKFMDVKWSSLDFSSLRRQITINRAVYECLTSIL